MAQPPQDAPASAPAASVRQGPATARPDPAWKEWIRPYYLRWIYFPLHPRARPRAWRDCWRYPEAGLSRPHLAPPPESRDFLFFPMTDWHARIQRTQQLARALARRGHRCLYLNPHLGREFPDPPGFGPRTSVRRLEHDIWELHMGLPREPVFHHRLLRPEEHASLAARLQAIASQFDVRRLVVISSFPIWLETASAIAERCQGALVYDCHDLLGGFPNVAPEIVAREAEALRQAALALFSAASLRDEWVRRLPELAPKAILLRNGVDASRFLIAPLRDRETPAVGYIGALDHWFDTEALAAAARALPRFRFLLYGRVEHPPIRSLAAFPNVELRGEIPYQRLPEAMAEFDVALIPFRLTPLTLATNPIKVYEYFSCGLPVVSAPLPEVIGQFPDLAYAAASPEEYVTQITRAARESDLELRARRRAVAERESWDARAATLLAALEEEA